MAGICLIAIKPPKSTKQNLGLRAANDPLPPSVSNAELNQKVRERLNRTLVATYADDHDADKATGCFILFKFCFSTHTCRYPPATIRLSAS